MFGSDMAEYVKSCGLKKKTLITQNFWKTFYFFCFQIDSLKDQPWRTFSWAHFRKEAGSWQGKKSHSFNLIRPPLERLVLLVSAGRVQLHGCWCFSRLSCSPSFPYSSVTQRTSNQILNYTRAHSSTDPEDTLASSLPLWCIRLRCINNGLPVPAQSVTQSWQVGNVGKEALSPPLLQVDGHKVCTENELKEKGRVIVKSVFYWFINYWSGTWKPKSKVFEQEVRD